MSVKRDYQIGELVPGTVYQVVREIGAGGMGTVYDVEDTTIGKRYVLKTLHPELGDRQDLARRMQNEARTLARLNHPNIVEVVTAGVTADDMKLPYYVMERLNGQNLRVVLQKKGQLELPHAYHIAIDLLDALDHAHDKGVIHRDVKPDNIFLHKTVAGVTVTKLLDFGIMSLLDGGKGETGGRFLGTLRYAAPEQLKGEKPTPKMDIYAAALVLYEMIAGRGPFDDAGEQHRVAAARLHEGPPPLGRFATVPPEVESLMRSALSIDPSARPRDAFSFASTLRNLKRAAASVHPREFESTENRPTVNAVLSQAGELPRPAVVKAQPEAAIPPPSPLAHTPAPSAALVPPPQVGPSGVPLAKTTMVGMAPPTVGGRLPEAAPPSFAPAPAGAGAVDRSAPTRSLVVDTPRLSPNNTDMVGSTVPLPPSAHAARPQVTLRVPSHPPPPAAPPGSVDRTVPAGMAPPAGQAPPVGSAPQAGQAPQAIQPPQAAPPLQFVWPQERKETDRSDSAQVHSMNAAASGPARGRLAIILAAVVGVVGLVVTGVFVARHVNARAAAESTAPSSGVTTASPPPAPPEPESPAAPAAPVIPPPVEASSAAPAPSTSSSASPAPPSARAAAPPVGVAPSPIKPPAAPPAPTKTTAPAADKSIKVHPGF